MFLITKPKFLKQLELAIDCSTEFNFVLYLTKRIKKPFQWWDLWDYAYFYLRFFNGNKKIHDFSWNLSQLCRVFQRSSLHLSFQWRQKEFVLMMRVENKIVGVKRFQKSSGACFFWNNNGRKRPTYYKFLNSKSIIASTQLIIRTKNWQMIQL